MSRDPRLGAHAAAAQHRDDRREDRQGDPAHPAQVPDRHRQGGQGAVGRGQVADDVDRADGRCSTCSTGSSSSCATPGCPVSLTENLDAMEAVQHIPIEDREAFKYALGATLVKNNAHWRAFETVFEVYFSLRGPEYRLPTATRPTLDEMWREMQDQMRQGEGKGAAGGAMDSLTPEEIAQLLMQALLQRRPGDDAGAGQPGRAALRRDGAGPPGRRHVLPVPHAAQPRPRRHAREADGGHPRAGRRRADAARGAPRARGVPGPHRASSRARSRPRSAAGWSPTAAPRRWPRRCASRCPRTSSSCTPPATRCSRCARRCTR